MCFCLLLLFVEKVIDLFFSGLVNSYGLNGMGLKAVELYYQIPEKFINESTYVCVLNACSHSGLVHQARSIFANIPMKTERIFTTMVCQTSSFSYFFVV